MNKKNHLFSRVWKIQACHTVIHSNCENDSVAFLGGEADIIVQLWMT